MTEHIASISEQTRLFLGSCLLGLPIGICLDCFRFLRMLLPHHKIAVFLEDAALVLFSALLLQSYALMFAHGSLRGYFALGAALGLTLYLLTIGLVWIRILRKFKDFFRAVPVSICMILKKSFRFFVGCYEKKPSRHKTTKKT